MPHVFWNNAYSSEPDQPRMSSDIHSQRFPVTLRELEPGHLTLAHSLILVVYPSPESVTVSSPYVGRSRHGPLAGTCGHVVARDRGRHLRRLDRVPAYEVPVRDRDSYLRFHRLILGSK